MTCQRGPAVVHQATGMIAVQCVCTVDEAYVRLVQLADDRHESVVDVSRLVVERVIELDP